ETVKIKVGMSNIIKGIPRIHGDQCCETTIIALPITQAIVQALTILVLLEKLFFPSHTATSPNYSSIR
ncbi:hypothetical protein ACFLXY_11055, partial [Chloroflexota bacterium]